MIKYLCGGRRFASLRGATNHANRAYRAKGTILGIEAITVKPKKGAIMK